ncbi:helix-turn-helix transcriptional regulator [Novisyntrophococcus fermenticellae]|uniref:helix-turn-helix transcriptional regulator n=1 Tax=Novisyntrophococcus fermenticellae TaxID=2068655 RepID=UPI001E3DAEB6|nr:AraC family transcriptional regulator [Novisyntrophococcus fermenticellae]
MPDNYKQYKEMFSESFSVQHKITTTSVQGTYHIHDDLELILLCSDGMDCNIGDTSHTLSANTLLIFNHMDLHYNHLTHPGTPNERYVVVFKPEFIDFFSSVQTDLLECFYFRPFKNPCILPLSEDEASQCRAILERIIQSADMPDTMFGFDLYPKFLLGEFLLKVNQQYRNYHTISFKNTSDYHTIYQVINYIHMNYDKEITLNLLSDIFFINKSYLCTSFREVTGMSPNQYLIHCRIMKAKELLLCGTGIDDVCSLAGYNNLSHFSRSFKEKTGISPKKYQMLHKT